MVLSNTKNLCIFTMLLVLHTFAHEGLTSKAIRPDAPVYGDIDFPGNCLDCYDVVSKDCCNQTSGSSCDELVSRIDELFLFEESCCQELTSLIDGISTGGTCCDQLNSKLDALTSFEESCCSELSSLIDELTGCSCCQNVITQADIDTGSYTITNPGVYCLASDVTFSSGNAITINNTNSQVIIDLQGNTITGLPGSVNGIFINTVTGGTTIRNGAISGTGILAVSSSDIVIDSISIYSPAGNGISIQNPVVVSPQTYRNFEISNVLIDNAQADGIFLTSCINVLIENTSIALSAQSGVHLDAVSASTLRNIAVSGSGNFGYRMEAASQFMYDLKLENCVSQVSINSGFYMDAATNFIVSVDYKNCIAKSLNPGASGFSLFSNAGQIGSIIYTNCSASFSKNGFETGAGTSGAAVRDILYQDCIAQNNSIGFFIDGEAINLRSCIADINTADGITLTTSATDCQVLSCSVTQNANNGINDANVFSSNLVYSNTAVGNGINYSASVPLQLRPTDITGHWINVDNNSSIVGEYESKIDAILACSCCENSINPDQISAGGYTITGDGIYCLSGDALYIAGPAITINPPIYNQIILDLGGHTITCDPVSGTGPTIQINAAGTGGSIIIRNGAFSGGDGNIIINNGQSIILENLRFNFTTNGVSVISCNSCNNILINDVEIRGSAANGIEFSNSTNCWVKNSLIEGSAQNGFYVNQSSNISCTNVRAFNNTNGYMVDGSGYPISTTRIFFENCFAESNNQRGFLIQNNDVFSSSLSGVVFESCQATKNGNYGFSIETTGTGSQIVSDILYTDCVSANNGAFGFYTDGSPQIDAIVGVTYVECQAQGNSGPGYQINTKDVVIKNGTATRNNSSGIHLDTLSTGCQVISCSVLQNATYGIQDDGTNNLVYSNIGSDNGSGNYSPAVPLQLKPTDITGYWINVDTNTSLVGEYESKIDALLAASASCSCCPIMITNNDIAGGNSYIITQPGLYCLAENLTFSTGGFAIQVFSSTGEVVIDMRGLSITGLGGGNGIYINSSADITVKNGVIVGVDTGIAVSSSTRIHLDDLNIKAPASYGIAVYGNSAQTTISNVVVDHAGINGIFLNTVAFMDISYCELTQNASYGLLFDTGSQVKIAHVRAQGNGISGFGVNAQSGCSQIEYVDCNAEYNGQSGYMVTTGPDSFSTASNIIYNNCVAINSNAIGFELNNIPGGTISGVEYINCSSLGNVYGFSTGSGATGSSTNTLLFDSCITQSNTKHGFFVDCDNAIMRNCISQDNNGEGILMTGTSTNCQVLSCSVSGNSGTGINDQGINNLVYANTAVSNAANYSPTVPLQLKPTDITGHWINVDPTSSTVGEYESKIDAILAATTCQCCQFLITQEDINTGSYTIEKPGIYCLATDVSLNAGNGIRIVNSQPQVILDLQGHTIDGLGSGGYGVLISGSTGGIIVRNGTIYQSENGIAIERSTNVNIENINIYNPIQYGIVSKEASQMIIENIVITNSGKDGIGLYVGDSIFLNNITMHSCSNNGLHFDGIINSCVNNINTFGSSSAGFQLNADNQQLTNILIKNCHAETNRNGSFILTGSGSGYNVQNITFLNCTGSYSDTAGFYLMSSSNGSIENITYENCYAAMSRFGFLVEQNNSDLIDTVVFKNCSSENNFAQGFRVTLNDKTSNNFIFKDCLSTKSREIGFYIQGGYAHLVENCIASFNEIGILVLDTQNSQFLASLANNNGANGIDIRSNTCLIKDCRAAYNGQDGIVLNGGNNNEILNCQASFNTKNGINDNAAASRIYGNSAFNNGVDYNPFALSSTAVPALGATYWSNVY